MNWLEDELHAPKHVFEEVAEHIKAAGIEISVIDPDYQDVRLESTAVIWPSWGRNMWMFRDADHKEHHSDIPNECENVTRILAWLNTVGVQVGPPQYKPSKKYPKGHQQMLCL